jgi:hypothetical protein
MFGLEKKQDCGIHRLPQQQHLGAQMQMRLLGQNCWFCALFMLGSFAIVLAALY